MFVRRVLWNTPKINPKDFRTESQDQTLPESPQLPPLTPPPTPLADHIAYSKRRKRPRTASKLGDASPKPEKKRSGAPKIERKHAVARSKHVPLPECSSVEQVKGLIELLQREQDLCRLCADPFCRDQTWGDPYLISCAKCEANYHSFCASDDISTKDEWQCYKCQNTPVCLNLMLLIENVKLTVH